MRKHHDSALVLFARTPKTLGRNGSDGPLAAIAWDDLEILYTALLGDVVRNACLSEGADVFVYRNPNEYSDDFFLPFRQRVELCVLEDVPVAEQIQGAIDHVFRSSYHRLVILLENNPLTTSACLNRIFGQLRYEDDCLVVKPSAEGKCTMIGMKANHSELFDVADGDPLEQPHRLIERCCTLGNNMLFLLPTTYMLDSVSGIAQLKREIEAMDRARAEFPSKTYEVMKILDKKYRARKGSR